MKTFCVKNELEGPETMGGVVMVVSSFRMLCEKVGVLTKSSPENLLVQYFDVGDEKWESIRTEEDFKRAPRKSKIVRVVPFKKESQKPEVREVPASKSTKDVDEILNAFGGVDEMLEFVGGVDNMLEYVGGVDKMLNYVGGPDKMLERVGGTDAMLDRVGGVKKMIDHVGGVGEVLDRVGGIENLVDRAGGVEKVIDRVEGEVDILEMNPKEVRSEAETENEEDSENPFEGIVKSIVEDVFAMSNESE